MYLYISVYDLPTKLENVKLKIVKYFLKDYNIMFGIL